MRKPLLGAVASAALLAAGLPAVPAQAEALDVRFVEFESSATRIDADHDRVTFTGRVVLASDPTKAAVDAPVSVDCPDWCGAWPYGKVKTGADGRFTINARLLTGSRYRAVVDEYGPSPVRSEPVDIVADPQEAKVILESKPGVVAPGARSSYKGQVIRKSAAGWRSADNVIVGMDFASRDGAWGSFNLSAWNAPNGSFELDFDAWHGGCSTFRAGGGQPGGLYKFVEMPGQECVTVRHPTAIKQFDVSEPAPLGGEAAYRLTLIRQFSKWYPFPGRGVGVYFRAKGSKTWKLVTTGKTDKNGVATGKVRVSGDGDWQARPTVGQDAIPSVSANDYVDARYMTLPVGFNAAPEPVRKGKQLTLSGGLAYFFPKAGDKMGYKWLVKRKVYFYFLPKGAKKWAYLGSAVTDSKGKYKRKATAKQDGTWRAYFPGDKNTLKSYQDDYVDVR